MKYAIPPDFQERVNAGEGTTSLARHYDVSASTVRRWRHGGRYKGDDRKKKRGEPEEKDLRYVKDTPEQIAACLNCTRKVCRGNCKFVREVRKRRTGTHNETNDG